MLDTGAKSEVAMHVAQDVFRAEALATTSEDPLISDGTPLATTEKVTVPPSQRVALAGCEEITGDWDTRTIATPDERPFVLSASETDRTL
jgi:hypothetical protein